MARVLFLVHGMGVHGADWASEVRTTLGEVASRYDKYDTPEAFFAKVEIVPVTYDSVFAEQLARWQDAADDLKAFTEAERVNLGTGTAFFNWLATATEQENNFFWSHMVDVLLYRYVQDVTKQVRLHVMREIAGALEERMRGGQIVRATVLAHSLGTAVAHDALHGLGSIELDGSRAFMAENFAFQSLVTLANVSRVLQTAPGPYESAVFPRTRERPGGYVRRYFDFRHAADPIPAVRPFAPVGWARGLSAVLGLDFFRAFNVHGFSHHLDSPRVHIPLLNALVARSIPADEAEAAISAYPRVAGIGCAAELASFVDRAKGLVALVRGTDDPMRLVIAGAQFLAAAKAARDACL